MKISKRLIQTAKNADLGLLARAAVANVKLLNPDFEYMFFDDCEAEEFVQTIFPEYFEVFRSFRFPIQQYDFFRYLAVYHFGGFYLDLDVFLAHDLSPLLDYACVFPFEELGVNPFLAREHGIDWQIGNYAFGAAPGHPFLRSIIENCVRAQQEPEWMEPMLSWVPRVFQDLFYIYNATGAGHITRTFAEYAKESGDEVTILFPVNVHDPLQWHNFGEYGVHLMKGTWRKEESAFRRRMYWLWWSWMRRKVNRRVQKMANGR